MEAVENENTVNPLRPPHEVSTTRTHLSAHHSTRIDRQLLSSREPDTPVPFSANSVRLLRTLAHFHITKAACTALVLAAEQSMQVTGYAASNTTEIQRNFQRVRLKQMNTNYIVNIKEIRRGGIQAD